MLFFQVYPEVILVTGLILVEIIPLLEQVPISQNLSKFQINLNVRPYFIPFSTSIISCTSSVPFHEHFLSFSD